MNKNVMILAGVLAFLFSCVSAPEKRNSVPEWTLTTPEPDSANTYFVGSASNPTGDEAAAADDATANLIAEIMRYIGVNVTAETNATARSTLDTYKADMVQTVKQSSSNKISGFSVKERYVAKDPNSRRATVYILGKYATADLVKEKKRIEAAFQEKLDAVAKPEAEGSALMQDGRPVEAAQRFIDAAAAASKSDIQNADLKFNRNVNNARQALSKIRFVKLNDNLSASLNQAFPDKFKAKLVFGESDTSPGIPGASVAVTYQRKQASGRLVGKTDIVQTDSQGMVAFLPPNPDFVGKAKLTMALNLEASLNALNDLPSKFDSVVSSLEEVIKDMYVEFNYAVVSNARNLLTAFAVVDLDGNGQAVAGSLCQGGILESLSKEKFKVKAAALEKSAVASMDEAKILGLARSELSGQAPRFAYGTAKIQSVVKDGRNYLATAEATVISLDLESGMVLYTASKSTVGIESNETEAMKTALKELGVLIAKDLMVNLP